MKYLVFFMITCSILLSSELKKIIKMFNDFNNSYLYLKNENTKKVSTLLHSFENICKKTYNKKACYYAGYINDQWYGYYNKAIPYYKIACDYNYSLACKNLAYLYYNTGWGRIHNKEKDGLKLYEKACKLNNGFSCVQLGLLYKDENEYSKALKYFKKAFNFKEPYAAINLGDIYRILYNKTLKENFKKKELFYYKYSCEKFHNTEGCDYYKRLVNFPPNILGLIIGQSDKNSFLYMCKKYKCHISKEGYMVLRKNLDNPNVYGYIVDKGLPIKNLDFAIFWFYKNKLAKIVYFINDTAFYESLLEIFYKKYGSYYRDNTSKYSYWKYKNYFIKIESNEINNKIIIKYTDKLLENRWKQENKKLINNYINTQNVF